MLLNIIFSLALLFTFATVIPGAIIDFIRSLSDRELNAIGLRKETIDTTTAIFNGILAGFMAIASLFWIAAFTMLPITNS